MNKTLLNHFTLIDAQHHEPPTDADMNCDSLTDLVSELRQVLKKAEKELLSPRQQAIDNVLKAAN